MSWLLKLWLSNRQHGFDDDSAAKNHRISNLQEKQGFYFLEGNQPDWSRMWKWRVFFPFYRYRVRKWGFTVPFCSVQYWSCIQASFVSLVSHCLSLLHVGSLCLFEGQFGDLCTLLSPSLLSSDSTDLVSCVWVIDSSLVRRTTLIFINESPFQKSHLYNQIKSVLFRPPRPIFAWLIHTYINEHNIII